MLRSSTRQLHTCPGKGSQHILHTQCYDQNAMNPILNRQITSSIHGCLQDMEDDTNHKLSHIHSNVTSLVEQLIEIQCHVISREKSEAWAEKLRFVDISKVPNTKQPHRKKKRRMLENVDAPQSCTQVLPVTNHRHAGKNAYIAVSWRWKEGRPSGLNPDQHKYKIQRRGDSPYASRMPDQYFDWAIRFAQAQRTRFLWIDTECIHQECPDDQSTGIQGMDLVYRNCRYALGILTVSLGSQRQVDFLTTLLKGELFDADTSEPRFSKGANPRPVLDVLRLIMSDERWDRTWIFQEDHCASSKMTLLLPCDKRLFKDTELYGDLDGELQISCAAFRRATTNFYLACDAKGCSYEVSLASKLRQYNVINQVYESVPNQSFASQVSEEVDDDGQLPTLLPSSLSILDDIRVRQNSVLSDRIAIWANCCRYYRRLDGLSLAQVGYGLSTAYLCLYLLNGEILNNAIMHPGDLDVNNDADPLDRSVYDLLNSSIIPITFDPPCEDYRQSFVDKYCRIGGVRLTSQGSKTSGWLWQVGEVINFSARDEEQIASLSRDTGDEPSGSDDSAMLILLRRLMGMECNTLAITLGQYLAKDCRSDDEVTEGYHFFVDKMIKAVLVGMRQQKTLCLARLVGDNEPRGVFVGTGHGDPAMVFTGFWKEEEKFVSIEVQHQVGTATDPGRLYPQAWMNGVWFAPRGTRKPFLFPYPFARS